MIETVIDNCMKRRIKKNFYLISYSRILLGYIVYFLLKPFKNFTHPLLIKIINIIICSNLTF